MKSHHIHLTNKLYCIFCYFLNSTLINFYLIHFIVICLVYIFDKLLKNNIFGVENTKLTIGIRPENLKIISGNLKIQSKSFTAKIVEKSFMGDTILYSIKLNQSENNNTYNISVSDIKNSPNPNIGDKISVTFEEDDVVAYYEE